MKLILCPKCKDVRKLLLSKVYCSCGECWGYYTADGLNAIINDKAIPLGFANSSLVEALYKRPESGMGAPFNAFIIPKECPTITIIA